MISITRLATAAALLGATFGITPAQALPRVAALQSSSDSNLLHQVHSRHRHHQQHRNIHRHRGAPVATFRYYRGPVYYASPYAYSPPIGLSFGHQWHGHHGHHHHHRHHGHH